MTKERLRNLLISYWDGSISLKTFEELVQYLQQHHDDKELEEVMKEVAELTESLQTEEVPTQAMYDNIIRDVRYRESTIPRSIKPRALKKFLLPTAIAASIALLMLFYFYPSKQAAIDIQGEKTYVEQSNKKHQVVPGRKQATLTLADGRIITVDSLQYQAITTQDGIRLSLENGQLVYDVDDKRAYAATNTISTPQGGEYEITLPDGTRVWLNAASSITYPIVFKDGVREVSINGEVYFEVAKNKDKAFVVKAGDTHIKVLGTHFNISAYKDDFSIKTTLIEGSVQVEKGNLARILKPGQQAETSDRWNNIKVNDVDMEEVLAWKNGYFLFNNENIVSAMKKISRWYNVDVVYESDLSNKGLDGTISKMEDIHQLLKALELTGAAKFELEERRIMIKE
ncbi:FecR family protein [Olivibacter sitiensis]|uniref:FecR family protein n=1 Tax=Olivibacter sitiensis TaxID=376470 RepID=UPI00041A38AD|nr:FecR family protein [Olivibacter sitiensis]